MMFSHLKNLSDWGEIAPPWATQFLEIARGQWDHTFDMKTNQSKVLTSCIWQIHTTPVFPLP